MINYQLLADSQKYYKEKGFRPIEVPWIVPKEIDNITKPIQFNHSTINNTDDCLVSSGEQSFLDLNINHNCSGFVRLQSITPCFRLYDIEGDLHRKYFMKNELFITDIVTLNELHKVIDIAFGFFEQYFDKNDLYLDEIDKYSYDITYKGIEIGSYGIRNFNSLEWIYGTGCAEPRMSTLCLNY